MRTKLSICIFLMTLMLPLIILEVIIGLIHRAIYTLNEATQQEILIFSGIKKHDPTN